MAVTRRVPLETRHTSRGVNNGRSGIDIRFTVYLLRVCKVSDDMVLGPPKMTFLSAGRGVSKASDSPARAAFGAMDGGTQKTDRLSYRGKPIRDGENDERTGDISREPRAGTMHGRRQTKEDNEPWPNAQQRRDSAVEDAERPLRRNGDRDSKGPIPRGFDNHRRDGDRERDGETVRRNGAAKNRHEPWSRDHNRQESGDPGHDRDEAKPRDWRNGGRAGTHQTESSRRDWNKQVEQEPEWMDQPEPEDNKQTHTQQDFEQWKQSMKAKTAPPVEPSTVAIEPPVAHQRTESGLNALGTKPKVETPLQLDYSIDDFFSLWNGAKQGHEVGGDEGKIDEPKKEVAKPAAAKASRFAGLFNPVLETKTKVPDVPISAPIPSTPAAEALSADQEGFLKIMQKLTGGHAAAEVANPIASSTQRGGLNEERNQQPATVDQSPSRDRMPQSRAKSPPPVDAPKPQKPNPLDALLRARTPRAAPSPQDNTGAFLLNLLQQPSRDAGESDIDYQAPRNVAPGTFPNQRTMPGTREMVLDQSRDYRPTSFMNNGLPKTTATDTRPTHTFYDLHSHDKLNPNATDRKQNVNIPPGLFDLPLNIAQQRAPKPAQIPGPQRPPGFDPLPQNYTQHVHPQRQTMVAPPPGFPIPTRNPLPFLPSLMSAMPAQNPVPSDRNTAFGVQQGAMGAYRPQVLNGMTGMPPPGFMINAPPPGFPQQQFPQQGQGGRMSPSGRHYYPGVDLGGYGGGFGMGGGVQFKRFD